MKNIIFSKKYILPSMVAYWKMENNVLDSKGSNHGTATAITYSVGKVGQAAVFNGSNSLIHCQNASFDFFAGAKYSFVVALKLNALPTSGNIYHPIMIQDGINTDPFDKGFRVFSNGSVGFFAFDGAAKTALSAPGVIGINTWYTLIGVFNGSSLDLYVNDSLVATVACSGSFNHTNPRIVLGHIHPGSSIALNGLIDEVTVFNNSLSTAERSDIFFKINNGQHLI